MHLPTMQGIIDRRILANYRVDPVLLRPLLPEPFRPQLARGFGVAGICLIRLIHIRPRGIPAAFGSSSENAAHRIAVEWEEDRQTRRGVYVPRRDTSSRLNSLAGGRLFAGIQHHARFEVRESAEQFHVAIASDDGQTRISIDAALAADLPPSPLFESLSEASAFFEAGSVGYSPSARPGSLDGIELRSEVWKVEPLRVSQVQSSFFDDASRFPTGSVEFDCALLMRGIHHEWHERDPIACLCVASA